VRNIRKESESSRRKAKTIIRQRSIHRSIIAKAKQSGMKNRAAAKGENSSNRRSNLVKRKAQQRAEISEVISDESMAGMALA